MTSSYYPVTFICNADRCRAQFSGSTVHGTTKAAKADGWLVWNSRQHWCPDCADSVRGRRRVPGDAVVPIVVVPGNPGAVKRAAS